jgi:hypothetical protein
MCNNYTKFWNWLHAAEFLLKASSREFLTTLYNNSSLSSKVSVKESYSDPDKSSAHTKTFLFQVHFNNILSVSPTFPKWFIHIRSFNFISHFSMHATCSAHLTIRNFVILIMFGENVNYEACHMHGGCMFLQPPSYFCLESKYSAEHSIFKCFQCSSFFKKKYHISHSCKYQTTYT